MTFINKLDREGRDPFELLDEIETVLGIATYPVTWPIGMGDRFRGVYHREKKSLLLFDKDPDRSASIEPIEIEIHDSKLDEEVGAELAEQFREEIELLEGAGEGFNQDRYLSGDLAPVFFGSALTNFGVQPLLDHLVKLAPHPFPRKALERQVDPSEEKFSAFIFKIQANMDPAHRDRVVMRICSGKFERGMKAHHVRSTKQMRLGRPTSFMAQDRSMVDEAYPGDIVGIHDQEYSR